VYACRRDRKAIAPRQQRPAIDKYVKAVLRSGTVVQPLPSGIFSKRLAKPTRASWEFANRAAEALNERLPNFWAEGRYGGGITAWTALEGALSSLLEFTAVVS
jgi:hypothetical protein